MIIADTGFFLALLNANDDYHQRCVAALERIKEPLITSWPVLTETSHLLLKRAGVHVAIKFMKQILDGSCEVYQIPPASKPRVVQLMKKYSDLPMDLADASLVLLAEHLGHGRILTTDRRDFRSYRWKERKPFENVL